LSRRPLPLADQRREGEADIHADRVDPGNIDEGVGFHFGRRCSARLARQDACGRFHPAGQAPCRETEHCGEQQKRNMRDLRNNADGAGDRGADAERLRVFADLRFDLLADILPRGDARDDKPGGDGDGERWQLCGQTIAHREQGEGARGIGQRQPVLQRADEQAADHVDDQDDHGRHHVAAHEFGGAVHRAEKICLAAQRLAPALGSLGREHAGVDLGIDRHLPAGQGIEHEACGHFRDAARPFRHHDEVDDDENDENDSADDVIAADGKLAEGFDDAARRTGAGEAVEQNGARGGNIKRQAHQRGGEQHGGEGRELGRRMHVEAGGEDHQTC
jgi:hypothetical protein